MRTVAIDIEIEHAPSERLAQHLESLSGLSFLVGGEFTRLIESVRVESRRPLRIQAEVCANEVMRVAKTFLHQVADAVLAEILFAGGDVTRPVRARLRFGGVESSSVTTILELKAWTGWPLGSS
jgi:23S rRNA pseudoU1915 N3-methylase RlmH